MDLRLIVEPVRLPAAGTDQMDYRVPARDEQLGDQAAVAARPERFRANEARRRFGKRSRERALPRVGSHPGGIAPEGRDPDAVEAFLAGLAAAAPAELLDVAVCNAGFLQRLDQPRLPELWIPPRAGETAHVYERLGVYLLEARDELRRGARPMPDREDSWCQGVE